MALPVARYVLVACACLTATRAQYGGSPSAGTSANMGSTGGSSYGASSAHSSYGGGVMTGGYGSSGSSGKTGGSGSGSSGSGGYGGSISASSAGPSYGASSAQSSYGGFSGYGSMMSSGSGNSASGYGSSGGLYGGSSGSYGNGGSYYTTAAPPASSTGGTTVVPVNTTCPSAAPIGCRYQALIDPVSGNGLFCLLVCDQPVTQAPTSATTPAPVTAPPAATVATPAVPVDPTILLQEQIEACIAAGLVPPQGCTFNGQGQKTPPITCAWDCQQSTDPIFENTPCDPTVGTIVERCLCTRAPPTGCTFSFRGGNLSPLTCAVICGPPPGR